MSVEDVDFILHHDEPLLEYLEHIPEATARKIGNYVSRISEDGSTLQVGYGSILNALVSSFHSKKHLGIHTELLNDGIAELMKIGVANNLNKGIGAELLHYLTYLAKIKGLMGFTAEVLVDNRPGFSLFEKMGFEITRSFESGVYEMKLLFKDMDHRLTFQPRSA